MDILDVDLIQESQTRYLTYALSVVNSRALPDVRDGLKPVQRRILYAMSEQLNLRPDRYHRKSAAVVGEVLARFHPHGDSACYDAMVRMAQDFSLRYPLVDGQGNFGSLDGDAPAAYRYTEARLTAFAMEVIGDIAQHTVEERDNFDQTLKEPVVLPSRVPNLLVNGAAGIAVGMATAIPPHNLKEVVKALLLLLEDEAVSDSRIFSAIKGPDFPTGCLILNSPDELREIYRTGKGSIRMRGGHRIETTGRGKEMIVITSVPYGIDKSALVEKIADFIVARKVPQLVDVRDESAEDVRIVLELAPGAEADTALAFLHKYTSLQHPFHVNLTALIPTQNPQATRPSTLSLRQMLEYFVDFRLEVTRRKLNYEKTKLEERIHLLEGLVIIYDVLDEVIRIVRKSEGRADAAEKLQARFKLSEAQALFIVDLRIYQLSKTSIEEVTSELKEKSNRVKEIKKLLSSERLLKDEIATDLKRISEEFGDNRKSEIIGEYEEVEVNKEAYIQHEKVQVIITKDAWLKRIKSSNDPQSTRLREGDSISYSLEADTRDFLYIFSTKGNVYAAQIYELPSTSGFGEPVQKTFRFADGEQIAHCAVFSKEQVESADAAKSEYLLFTKGGFGFRFGLEQLANCKKSGKRLAKLSPEDQVAGLTKVEAPGLIFVSQDGYVVYCLASEVPKLSGAGKGVILSKLPPEDSLVLTASVAPRSRVAVACAQGGVKEIDISSLTIMGRAKRGLKLVKRGLPVVGLAAEPKTLLDLMVAGKKNK